MDNAEIHIDGDKVIAFINAVKSLGKILEQVNVIEIKDAFLIGSKHRSVQSIIEQEIAWKDCLARVRSAMDEEVKVQNLVKTEYWQMLQITKQAQAVYGSSAMKEGNAQLKEFVELCDRLEKHKESGTFALVQALLK